MDHGAIGAQIEPAVFWIAGNSNTTGADEPAAVQFVDFRDGKFQKIDALTGHFVFEDRPSLDDPWWNRLQGAELFFKPAHQFEADAVHRQPSGKREPAV